MKLRPVPRESTEAAIYLLHTEYVHHMRFEYQPQSLSGRFVSGPVGHSHGTSAAANRQATFFRLVSITESYLDSLFGELFEERVPDRPPVLERLVESAQVQATASWQAREDGFRNHHQILLTQCANWSQIKAAIEVRNAVAHGVGQLTRRQRRSNTEDKFETIGVRLSDDQVIISVENLQKCRDVCVGFIESVDIKSR